MDAVKHTFVGQAFSSSLHLRNETERSENGTKSIIERGMVAAGDNHPAGRKGDRQTLYSGPLRAKARGKKLDRQIGERPKSDRLSPKVMAWCRKDAAPNGSHATSASAKIQSLTSFDVSDLAFPNNR
ncbi:hypothetical protein BLA27_24700 [Brucella cytisi]|uniref:Uncharacterized protein n=1 Tax=Brucella cytisi TaxID=407152 RepID=A0A1J6HE75_9HYPH|nr:hypothetical protein BLA27_24700 [Brucella cytisi]